MPCFSSHQNPLSYTQQINNTSENSEPVPIATVKRNCSSSKLFKISIAILKSTVLFVAATYILGVPFFVYKFNLIDGINIYGFTQPSWFFRIETALILFTSIALYTWFIKTAYGVRKIV